MEQKTQFAGRLVRVAVAGVLFTLSSATTSHAAAVHVVTFGGSVGSAYAPSTLSVSVGDTIRWQGNFEFHPLASATVPAGAAAFANTVGTSFDYVVGIPGTYNYICGVHAPDMSGSFNATLAGVGEEGGELEPAVFELRQNYPNPFNPSTTIGFTVGGKGSGMVNLTVYNLIGQAVATVVNERLPAGNHSATFDARDLPSGVYVYRLEADGFRMSRAMVLMR
jgi:plastocyanin